MTTKRALAGLHVDGRQLYLGRWPSRREADIARDRAALKLKLDRPLRYPREARRLGPASAAELVAESHALEKAERSSRFSGVSQNGKTGKWRVSFKAKGRKYDFTGFADEESAAVVRDRLALHLLGKAATLNFPTRRLKPASFAQLQLELREQRTASRYRGVSYDAGVQRSKWSAEIVIDYTGVFLGRYQTERAAALAYDRAALYYLGKRAKLNLPRASAGLGPASFEQLRREARAELKKQMQSRFRGVSPNRSLWAASIRHRGKAHYLGSFVSDEEAAEAYDKAALRLHGARARLNF
jgi:AP2-like factor (ANT lineage)